MSKLRLAIVLLVGVAFAAYFSLDLGQYLTLGFVQSQLDVLRDYSQQEPLLSSLIYFGVYVWLI